MPNNLTIIKRNGKRVPYNSHNVYNAIKKGFLSVRTDCDDDIRLVFNAVETQMNVIAEKQTFLSVGVIQDLIVNTIEQLGYPDVAESYNNYRVERDKMRASFTGRQNKLVKAFEKLTVDADENNDKRENANVDGNTAMGTMLQFGTTVSKEYAKSYLMNEKFSLAHDAGDIHIHDMDFMASGCTTTCTQISLDRLFARGFNTGHGYLRPPKGILTYAALACIAIQSNQNDQHGGQAIPLFDYYMAPGVLQTFKKHLRQQIYAMFDYEDIQEKLNIETMDKIINNQKHMDFNPEILYALIPKCDNYEKLIVNINKCYKRAIALTDRDTFQAMEALVANLNTMHSRCGAQVPFSSLNYGTDTSPEGRMVIKNLLLAEEAGLGDGETPIFPIAIFKVKEGVNYNPEDPNYDMLQLACRVTSLRLFPNFAFLDAPFNKVFYKEGNPETEVGYMGCVAGEETITYKISNNLFVENFKNAYSRLADLYGEKLYGESCYVDLSATPVTIYDSIKHSFVQIKKIIKNPNKNNWKEIRFSNGRSVLATSDHPFYIIGKGRTFAKDLVLGDKTLKSKFNFNVNVNNKISEDEAWLLGLILCDGNYNNNIFLSFGKDEIDIIEKVESVCAKLGLGTSRMYQERGVKGSYIDLNIKCGDNLHIYREKLETIFGGKQKINRNIPNFIYTEKRSVKMAFVCGMIDADGYMSKHFDNRKHNTVRGNLGSTNKTLALQQMMLLETLGYNTKLYPNKYNGTNKYRYKVEFEVNNEFAYLASQKKLDNLNGYAASKFDSSNEIKIINITDYDYTDCSYDVETESDMFDVSGIVSHNCRTRVMANVYSKRKEVISGRGNLSFTTINLPRLGIKYGIALGREKADMDGFFNELESMCNLVKDQLLERYKLQAKKKVKNFPFLMGAGVWQDSEKLNPEDTLEKVLKHGTLTIGFIGLSECLIALTGKHHAESPESQELGLNIIKFMRAKTDSYCEKYKMNFSLIATPAEGLSGRFIKIDKERFGVIPRVTDKEYYTNSNHVDVRYPISVKEKLAIEAPYHELTNGGHIAYVELDGLTASNPEAIMQVVRMMHDAGVGYGAINHPVDRDPVCGYTGIIGDVCPRCGRKDGEEVPLDLVVKYKGSIYHHYKIADKPNIFDPTTPNTLDVPDAQNN